MDKSKKAVVRKETLSGILSTVVGWIITLLFFILIIGLFMGTSPHSIGWIIGYIILFFIGMMFIGTGINNKNRVRLFEQFITLLTAEPSQSITKLAAGTGQAPDVVEKSLKEMIQKNYFKDTYIDQSKNSIIFNQDGYIVELDNIEYITVKCKGCGAANKVAKGSASECEYCGSKINTNKK